MCTVQSFTEGPAAMFAPPSAMPQSPPQWGPISMSKCVPCPFALVMGSLLSSFWICIALEIELQAPLVNEALQIHLSYPMDLLHFSVMGLP